MIETLRRRYNELITLDTDPAQDQGQLLEGIASLQADIQDCARTSTLTGTESEELENMGLYLNNLSGWKEAANVAALTPH